MLVASCVFYQWPTRSSLECSPLTQSSSWWGLCHSRLSWSFRASIWAFLQDFSEAVGSSLWLSLAVDLGPQFLTSRAAVCPSQHGSHFPARTKVLRKRAEGCAEVTGHHSYSAVFVATRQARSTLKQGGMGSTFERKCRRTHARMYLTHTEGVWSPQKISLSFPRF